MPKPAKIALAILLPPVLFLGMCAWAACMYLVAFAVFVRLPGVG